MSRPLPAVLSIDALPSKLTYRYDLAECESAARFRPFAGELYEHILAELDITMALLVVIVTSQAVGGVGPAFPRIGLFAPHAYPRTRAAAKSWTGRRRIEAEWNRQLYKLTAADYDVASPGRERLLRFLAVAGIAAEEEMAGNYKPGAMWLGHRDPVLPEGTEVFDLEVAPEPPLFGSRELEALMAPHRESVPRACGRCPIVLGRSGGA